MQGSSGLTTFLFTDIEGSTRLWEQSPEAMRGALARHDAISRAVVDRHRGTVVKTTGDGIHAVFDDPLDALAATLDIQRSLADPAATAGVELRVRCGLHTGVDESRDNDFFGRAVNRAARIMSAAHGGQILVSQAVEVLIRDRLPSDVSLRDLGRLRLRDLESPEQIFQVAHPALRASFPALRSLESTPNNLPQQMTSFIGREREKAEVMALLGTTRLLTLVGPGGIGKTRLSLHVAADVQDAYPDGVWQVELASLTDARLVPQAVASVLGVKEHGGRPVADALATFVADRRLLLVLDNCEHLLDACAELAKRLLHAGPLLQIMASSREGLHVTGETIYPLPPLAVPEAWGTFKVRALESYAAARLFIERATAAQPSFQLSDDNATAVATICQRLDGIPLALELAAARVRALPVGEIAVRLTDRFRLLTGGDRTALPRQQTLRALIDWSHDLLTPPERVLFRRLSVFAGGFTLDAAEAVGRGHHGTGTDDVLTPLTHLVEKSLVVLDPERGRYRLLDTVRHYAHEQLVEAADAVATRDRHLDFYLALAEAARPELVGPQQAYWIGRLDAERENLLAAHTWCDVADGGGEHGLRLLDAIKFYLLNRGLLVLGRRLLVEALGRKGAQLRNLPRARALFDAGQICNSLGHYGEAIELLGESLAISREIGDSMQSMQSLQPLGEAARNLGDLDAARRYLDEAVARSRESTDRRELAAALVNLGQLHRLSGHADDALPLYVEGVALLRELGDRESVGLALLNVAMVSIGRGEVNGVPATLREVADIAMESGSKPVGQSLLEVAAAMAAVQRDWPRAARYFGAAEAQAEATGFRRDPTDEAFLAPHVAAARREFGQEAFAAEEAAGRALRYTDALADTRAWLDGRTERMLPPLTTRS